MAENLDSIGGRLRHARKEKGLTQEQVAAHLHLTSTAYGHYERGRGDISLYNIRKFAGLTGFRVDWLLTGEGEMAGVSNEEKENLWARYVSATEKEKEMVNFILKKEGEVK